MILPDHVLEQYALVLDGLAWLEERHPIARKAIAQAIEQEELSMDECTRCAVGSTLEALGFFEADEDLGWNGVLRMLDPEQKDEFLWINEGSLYGFLAASWLHDDEAQIAKDQGLQTYQLEHGVYDVLEHLWCLAVLGTTHPKPVTVDQQ